jgi:hypothetical protein
MLKVEHQDELCRIGNIGPIFASAWRAVPNANHIAVLREAFGRRLAAPDPIGILVIGVEGGEPPSMSDAIRGDLISLFKSASGRPGPTAIVVEDKGFIAAFLRSLFAAIFLLAGGIRHNKVFGTRAEAIAWLVAELGPSAPKDLAGDVSWLARGLS